jgi:hypothetical protein
MLVLQGYFDSDRFIPDTPVKIPQKVRATVTIAEQAAVPKSRPKKSAARNDSWRSLYGRDAGRDTLAEYLERRKADAELERSKGR